MIAVSEELEKRSIPFTIDMIGDGPLKDKVEIERNKLKQPENVILHRLLPNDEVWQLMAQADALVMTSNRQEGWNAAVAAERFLKVYENCKSEGGAVFYDNGLLSKA